MEIQIQKNHYYCKLCNHVLGSIKFLLVAIDEIEKEIKENVAKM